MAEFNAEILIQHLKEKWKMQGCPLCGARNWNLQEKSYELREFHGGNLVVGSGVIIPVIPVTCTNCGNTILVNSIIAGVESKGKDSKNE